MMPTVSKSFNTPLRRFVAGEPISAADDLAPHDYDDLVARGFIDDPRAAESPRATPPRPSRKRR
jgi:hypothetical protein